MRHLLWIERYNNYLLGIDIHKLHSLMLKTIVRYFIWKRKHIGRVDCFKLLRPRRCSIQMNNWSKCNKVENSKT